MISAKLQNSVNQLRMMIRRGNNDISHGGTAILDSMEAEIERLRGFENVVTLDDELMRALREKADEHVHH